MKSGRKKEEKMKKIRIAKLLSIVGMVLVVIPFLNIMPLHRLILLAVGIEIILGTIINLLIKILQVCQVNGSIDAH